MKFEVTDTESDKKYTLDADGLKGGLDWKIIKLFGQHLYGTIPEEDIKRYYDIAMDMKWQDGWYSTPEMKEESKTPGYKHITLGGSDTERVDYEHRTGLGTRGFGTE